MSTMTHNFIIIKACIMCAAFLYICQGNINYIDKFVVDVIKYKKKISPPSKVSAFFCNNVPDSAVNFIRTMSNENVFVSFYYDSQNWSSIKYPAAWETVLFVLDLSCDISYSLLYEVNSSSVFSLPHHWLLLLNSNKTKSQNFNNSSSVYVLEDNSLSLINSLNFHIDSDVMVGTRTSKYEFVLFEIYRCAYNYKLSIFLLGKWNIKFGLVSETSLVISRRRANIQKAPLKTVFVVADNDSLNHLTDLHNSRIDSITKLNYKPINHVCELLNASFEAVYTSTWGVPVNGSWNGAVGYLQRKEADMAGTAFFLLPERTYVVDFILLLVPTRLTFIFKQPPLSSVTNVFVLPFNKQVWGCSIVVLIACGILLYFNFKWEVALSNDKQLLGRTDVGNFNMSWSDVFMYVLGAITEQGTTCEPQKIPGRIISLFLYIAAIFLITSYGACIVALLQTPANTITTLKDLLDSPLELGASNVSYNHYYLKAGKGPVRREIYEKKIIGKGGRPNFYNDISEGVRKIRNGLFAFHHETGPILHLILNTFLENEKCELTAIDFLEYNNAYQAVQKGSPYKELITLAFRKVYETGLFSRSRKRYYPEMPECVRSGSSNFISIGVGEFYPALLVLVYGLAACIFILSLEILIFNWLKIG